MQFLAFAELKMPSGNKDLLTFWISYHNMTALVQRILEDIFKTVSSSGTIVSQSVYLQLLLQR
jgi:hypothetical protein